MKRDVGADGKSPLAQRAQMNQADTGDDLMRPALQSAQHPARLGDVGGFAHDFTFEEHERVRPQHQRVGMFLGDDARLPMRIKLAQFQRRQLFVENFRASLGTIWNSRFNCCNNSARLGDAEARISGGNFMRKI